MEFYTKDEFKKHKKKEHRNKVEACTKFIENKCERSEYNCRK